MATFLTDSFTEGSDTTLASHTGELGATWTKHTLAAGSLGVVGATDRVMQTANAANTYYYASGTPASADYYVEGPVHYFSDPDLCIGPAGRMHTSDNTMYFAQFVSTAGGTWRLRKTVAGTGTTLGTYAQTLSAGVSYTVRLDMVGSTIRVLIDGVERISSSDSAITDVGLAGIRGGGVSTTTTGMHMDSISGVDTSGGGGSSKAAIADYYRRRRAA